MTLDSTISILPDISCESDNKIVDTVLSKITNEKATGSGSLDCPYKLAIIGGGPSGCSIVIRAIRIGVADDLFKFTNYKSPDSDNSSECKAAGVCLIDLNDIDKFGGGKLQDYVINSNTSANKFVDNVIEEKLDNLPKETIIKTPLDKLGSQKSAADLLEYGYRIAPLNKVGAFLRDTGSVVYHTLNKRYKDSSKCLLSSKAIALQKVDFVQNGLSGWKITVHTRHGEQDGNKIIESHIFAMKVTIATGGLQELPLLPNPLHSKKLMCSDYVLTERGITDLRNRLLKSSCKENNSTSSGSPGKVVIVGGSHSAFSAAWVCLHKLNSNPNNCKDSSENGSTDNSKSHSPLNSPIHINNIKNSVTRKEDDHFGPCGVCLIHKSDIKVFYTSKSNAERDKYTYFTENTNVAAPIVGVASNTGGAIGLNSNSSSTTNSKALSSVRDKVTGHIHPFGGLRGDAKQLWRAVRDGKESRLRMLQIKQNVITLQNNQSISKQQINIKQQAIIEKLFDEAVVIIWACGYTSNLQDISIFEKNGITPIHLKTSRGQVDVDDWARILKNHSNNPSVTVVSPHPVPSLGPTKSDNDIENSSAYSPNDKSINISISVENKLPVHTMIYSDPAPLSKDVVGGLFGTGLGFGLQVLLENGQPDGSSGRADGVAIYLKRGATLILAQVLGNKVFGGKDIKSWDERNKLLKQIKLAAIETTNISMSPSLKSTDSHLLSPRAEINTTLFGKKRPSTSSQLASFDSHRKNNVNNNKYKDFCLNEVIVKTTSINTSSFIDIKNNSELKKIPFPQIHTSNERNHQQRPLTTCGLNRTIDHSVSCTTTASSSLLLVSDNKKYIASSYLEEMVVSDFDTLSIEKNSNYDLSLLKSNPMIADSTDTHHIIDKSVVPKVADNETINPNQTLSPKNAISSSSPCSSYSNKQNKTEEGNTLKKSCRPTISCVIIPPSSSYKYGKDSSPRNSNIVSVSDSIGLPSKIRTISANNSLSPRKRNTAIAVNIVHTLRTNNNHCTKKKLQLPKINCGSSLSSSMPLATSARIGVHSQQQPIWINPLNGTIVRSVTGVSTNNVFK